MNIRLLENVNLFKSLSTAELEAAAALASEQSREKGSFFFHQGDQANKIYILISGKVKLTQVTPEGQQVILRVAGPGEAFGIIAVLAEAEYPAAAEVLENSSVLAWDRLKMDALIDRYPVIGKNAIRILANRIKEFQNKLREMATERVERRIARTLIRLSRQAGRKLPEGVLIDMPLTRQDLAEMTGTTLYTVSRILSHWESQGLVASKREQVVIRYPHGLVAIAEDLPSLTQRKDSQ